MMILTDDKTLVAKVSISLIGEITQIADKQGDSLLQRQSWVNFANLSHTKSCRTKKIDSVIL